MYQVNENKKIVVNVYILDNSVTIYTKQNCRRYREKQIKAQNTFNTLLSIQDNQTKLRSEDYNQQIFQIYFKHCILIIETTIFSSAYRIFTKIHTILRHRENISRFHNGNITKTLISAGKLDTKNKTTKKTGLPVGNFKTLD